MRELIPSGLLKFLSEKLNLIEEQDYLNGDYIGHMLCNEDLNYVEVQ